MEVKEVKFYRCKESSVCSNTVTNVIVGSERKPYFIKAQNVIKPSNVHLYTVLRCRGVSGGGRVGERGRDRAGEGRGRGQNEKLGVWKVEPEVGKRRKRILSGNNGAGNGNEESSGWWGEVGGRERSRWCWCWWWNGIEVKGRRKGL